MRAKKKTWDNHPLLIWLKLEGESLSAFARRADLSVPYLSQTTRGIRVLGLGGMRKIFAATRGEVDFNRLSRWGWQGDPLRKRATRK